MSDRLAVMNSGRVEQLGPPKQVYEEPETTFVADFLGIANLLSGSAHGEERGFCRVRVGEFELRASRGHLTARGETKLLVRPERVGLEPHQTQGENRLPGMVERVVFRGSNNQVFVRLTGGELIQVLVQNSGQEPDYTSGDPVRVHIPPEALRVLHDSGTAPSGDGPAPEARQELGSAIGS
jgi:ABC-type Fe3+/spermidine/putrescine transport system ATPase subunit